MSSKKFLLPLLVTLASILACGLPGTIHPSVPTTPRSIQLFPTSTSAVEEIIPTEAVTIIPVETATVEVKLGKIIGHVNYPSEFIAPQRVVIYLANDFTTYYTVDTALNQSEYSLEVPEGMYYVVSYLIDGGLSAGYSQAVPCGLSVDCTDHSLIPVIVTAGQTKNNIDIFDWYAPQGTFAPLP